MCNEYHMFMFIVKIHNKIKLGIQLYVLGFTTSTMNRNLINIMKAKWKNNMI